MISFLYYKYSCEKSHFTTMENNQIYIYDIQYLVRKHLLRRKKKDLSVAVQRILKLKI